MRSTSTASVTRPAWLALVVALLSCSRPPTRLVFRVLAENLVPAWCGPTGSPATPACPSDAYRVDSVLVRVCRGACTEPEANDCVGNDAELFCRTFVDGPVATAPNILPGDITVAPADSDAASRVGVVVIAVVRVPDPAGGTHTSERIRRRFVAPFVKESTQVVEVWLSSLCIGAVCPPETTCGRRSCEPVDDPPTRTFTPLPDAGPLDAGALDASFIVATRDAGVASVDVPAPMDVAVVMDLPVTVDVPMVMDAGFPPDTMRSPDDAISVTEAATREEVATSREDGAAMGCPMCARGSLCCGGVCRNVFDDALHCGGCGVVCASGELCCAGVCSSVDSDPFHCGSCGGICPRSFECCAGACADTRVTRTNCGACGTMCTTSQMCCDGVCTDPGADASLCGPPDA